MKKRHYKINAAKMINYNDFKGLTTIPYIADSSVCCPDGGSCPHNQLQQVNINRCIANNISIYVCIKRFITIHVL